MQYQEHPGDAEADEGALYEVGHPHQTELQDCYHYSGSSLEVQYDVDGSGCLKAGKHKMAAH